MRVLLISNMVSHHQLPFAESLAKAVGEGNFRFAALGRIPEDRISMGWSMADSADWILRPIESAADKSALDDWWETSDVVLCGEREWDRIDRRIHKSKLTFYMSERWWKPPFGVTRMLYPPFARMAFQLRKLSASKWLHYLPAGTYAALDMKRVALFEDKCWSWGYFPSLSEGKGQVLHRKQEERFRILWAGRMLQWKRVDVLVKAFYQLQKQTENAQLTLIGNGRAKRKILNLCKRLNLLDSVTIMPSMPPYSVRDQMGKAHVYVLPSNSQEGWGAVINEAMAEGCAVVASDATGGARALITDQVDGLLFKSGDVAGLYRQLLDLYYNEDKRRSLAVNGLNKVNSIWSPMVAANRFLAVSRALIECSPLPRYEVGPMAKIVLSGGMGSGI